MGCSMGKGRKTMDSSKTTSLGINEVALAATACSATPPIVKEVDSRLKLNSRQVYCVSKSWKAISRNMQETAITMFVWLFKSNEQFTKMFENLKGINLIDMRENDYLEKHALKVMLTLDETFSNLDDIEYVINMLHSTGRLHQAFPNYHAGLFLEMKHPFLKAVEETLGERYSDQMKFVYEVIIDFALNSLVEGFNSS